MRREGYLAHVLATGKAAVVADLRPYRVLLTDGRYGAETSCRRERWASALPHLLKVL